MEKSHQEQKRTIKEINLEKAKTKRKKKSKTLKIISGVAVLIFSIYALVTIVQLQTEISDREKTLAELYEDEKEINIMIEELEDIYSLEGEYKDDYIEDLARSQYDFAREGERVFINIAS